MSAQTLMARLASLLESHPYLATPAKVAIYRVLTAGGATSVAKRVAGHRKTSRPGIVCLLVRSRLPTMPPPEPSGKVLSGHATRARRMHGFRRTMRPKRLDIVR
ncbi:hypothetical protein ACNKHW_03045 [Shigella flexneri]